MEYALTTLNNEALMRKNARLIVWAFVLFFCFFGFCQPLAAQEKTHHFVLQGIHLQEGERIIGMDILVVSGAFTGISNWPKGWSLDVDDGTSCRTNIKGDAHVGAAAVDANDIQKIRFTINKPACGDLKFQMSGALFATKDFENVRKIPLGRNNFREECPAQ